MRQRSTRLALGLLVVLSTLGLFARQSAADPIVLDQETFRLNDVAGAAIIPEQSVSQTFTAGLSGLFSFIDISLYRQANAIGDIVLSLLTTPLDTSSAVFSTTIAQGSIPRDRGEFVRVSVAEAGVFVSPGDIWAIHLSRSIGGPANSWIIWNQAFPYEGGTAYTSLAGGPVAVDMAFRTFVDVGAAPVPEPTSLLLFGTGIALAWKARRRARCPLRSHVPDDGIERGIG